MRTRRPSARRSRRAAVAALALAVVGALLMPLAPYMPASEAQAVKAAGGAGRFTQAIEWFSWGTPGTVVGNGTRTTTSTVAGQQLTISCTISNLSGGLVAYRPGSWMGDAFDNLYNVGGADSLNRLDVGLATRLNGETSTFNLSCGATVGGVHQPLGGLVFADAEQSRNAEHVGATAPSGSTWRIIDRYRASCTQATTAVRPADERTRLELHGATASTDCPSGPAAVAFAENATSLTRVTVSGSGKSAIALGVMLAVDYGDAPVGYGSAAAVFQPGWSGGTTTEPSCLLGLVCEPGRTNVFDAGYVLAQTTAPTPRLGALVDADDGYPMASDGTADDLAGTDDEDASFGFRNADDVLVQNQPRVDLRALPGTSQDMTISCVGAGAPVRAWLDFDRSGAFDADESSTAGSCSSAGQATVRWTIPADVKPATEADPTFMRVRIVASGALEPTGITSSGEVEDHRVALAAPALATTKTTDVAAGTVQRVGGVIRYTVTLRNTGRTTLAAPTVVDDLSRVLDGATLAAAGVAVSVSSGTSGSVTRSGTTVSWSRSDALAVGATVTLSYSVTVTEQRRGQQLQNTATGAGSTPAGARLTAQATTSSTVGVALVVDKRWVIDGGTALVHGSQPSWLTAAPTISGQAGALFGSVYEGYAPGGVVQVGETVGAIPAWLPGCSIDARTITEVNGVARATSIASGSAAITLTQGLNRVVVTNAVTCRTTLSLAKVVQNGTASAGDFTLSATGPTGFSGRAGTSAASAPVTADAPYVLSESGPAVYTQQGGWACVPLNAAGASATGSGWTDAVDDRVSAPLGMHVRCTATNATAALVLLERIEGTTAIAAPQFSLTGSPASLVGLTTATVVGSESVSSANTIAVRPGHAYALSSSSSAPHVALRVEQYLGAVGPNGAVDHASAALWQAIDPASVSVAAGQTAIYRFVATAPTPLALPLTGGVGADAYLLGGTALLLLAAAVLLARTGRLRLAAGATPRRPHDPHRHASP